MLKLSKSQNDPWPLDVFVPWGLQAADPPTCPLCLGPLEWVFLHASSLQLPTLHDIPPMAAHMPESHQSTAAVPNKIIIKEID